MKKLPLKKRIMAYIMSFIMLAIPYYLGSINGMREHPVVSMILLVAVLMVATIRSSLFL